MIIADLLNISITLIFIAQIVVCVLLLGIVLMQRPKQEGLGAAFGGDLANEITGAHTTTVLQKGTVYLGSLFMIFSFVLSLLIVHRSVEEKSTLTAAPAAVVAPAEGQTAPVAPSNEQILKDLESGVVPATPLSPATPVSEPAPAPVK